MAASGDIMQGPCPQPVPLRGSVTTSWGKLRALHAGAEVIARGQGGTNIILSVGYQLCQVRYLAGKEIWLLLLCSVCTGVLQKGKLKVKQKETNAYLGLILLFSL